MRYVRHVIRIRDVARGYWFELLVAFSGDRGDARARRWTRLAGRTAYDAVDRRTCGGCPRAAAFRAPTLSVRRSCCLLDPGRGDLVRRRTVAGVHRQPRPGRVGECVPAREPRRSPEGGCWSDRRCGRDRGRGLQHPWPTAGRRLRIHPAPVRGRLGRGLRLA